MTAFPDCTAHFTDRFVVQQDSGPGVVRDGEAQFFSIKTKRFMPLYALP
jgi:hypothetical protein